MDTFDVKRELFCFLRETWDAKAMVRIKPQRTMIMLDIRIFSVFVNILLLSRIVIKRFYALNVYVCEYSYT